MGASVAVMWPTFKTGGTGMLSFKLKPENHARLSHWSKRLFFVVFVVAAGYLLFIGIDSYRHANSILRDHSVVTAPVELLEVTEERGRKGRRKDMYHFGYRFEVDGQAHEGRFTMSESNAGPYLADGTTLQVAYANADPAHFDRMERLQGLSGFGSLLVRMLIAVGGAALLAGLMHLLVVAKLFVPRKPEPEAESAAAS
jgi:hypothetical protein